MKPPASKLPHLLATLPKEGRAALVRPTSWPENSFYKVTRSALRFREDGEEVKPAGKAWGQLFWKGKLVQHPRRPAPQIPGGLKHRWVAIDEAALPAEARAAVQSAPSVLAEARKAQEARIEERRAKKAAVQA